MQQRDLTLLMLIIILAGLAIWVVWPGNPGLSIHFGPINIDRAIKIHSGLDLQGGMQVVLAADPAPGQTIDSDALAAAKAIVESRVNGLGVTEPLVQLAPPDRIVVELPGIQDPDLAISTLRQTGLLEFIDAGTTFLTPGTVVRSSYRETGEFGIPTPAPVITATPTIAATATPVPSATPAVGATEGVTPTVTAEPTPSPTPSIRIFRTVITGQHLKTAQVGQDEYGRPEIQFQLTDDGGKIFAAHTGSHIGSYLAIVMDGVVISCPKIETAITEASGRITGDFELAAARSIVVQLRYGALPVPLKVIQNRSVGPTLGQDSVAKSTRAGSIGVIIVLVFMLVYYRLHGLVADIALIIYALITFALFKLIPVTLTLPGIAGFLFSIGTAVDANILIFERMKEELRQGKRFSSAIQAGFDRAWTSIRDSNMSTFITCGILYWFGSNYGASMVKGFAVTLFLGVLVSMFTAITVTRTIIRALYALGGEKLRESKWLIGL
ncbi:MAG: preprotein translocase subunit SecD [Chloroflexi bacterium ADurb.Bin180]|nr:MAG: preprotein translocase subunit SecD [Chloroflexi bacterium ADurb.Bin180]